MPGIDLHIHSIYSDGLFTPKEIVNYASKKGLSAISITDHDTISGLDEGRKYSKVFGIRFINGVEINSCCSINDRNFDIHILGYMFNVNQIKEYMAKLKVIRDEHNNAIIDELNRNRINIAYEDLNMQSDKSTVTRINIARELVRKGYSSNENDALEKYLHKGGMAYVEFSNQPFSSVVQNIHEAGGIVSMAHPAEYGLDDIEIKSLVSYLAKNGLDAIECIHPTHDASYTHRIRNLAKQYNLLLTGGSDFHGENEDNIDLGMGGERMLIPESFLDGINISVRRTKNDSRRNF